MSSYGSSRQTIYGVPQQIPPQHIRPSPYRRNHLVYFSGGDKIYRVRFFEKKNLVVVVVMNFLKYLHISPLQIRQIASKTPQPPTPSVHELQRPLSSLSIAQQHQQHQQHQQPYNMSYAAQVPFPTHLPSH